MQKRAQARAMAIRTPLALAACLLLCPQVCERGSLHVQKILSQAPVTAQRTLRPLAVPLRTQPALLPTMCCRQPELHALHFLHALMYDCTTHGALRGSILPQLRRTALPEFAA